MSDYSEAVNKAADLVHRLAGPVCDDIGAMISDRIKPYRAKNLVSTLKKTERILCDAGLPANAVPTRVLFPIADASSIESNETLQELWAGLLASASQRTDTVSPSFIETLKQLTPDEAQYLEVMCQDSVKHYNDTRKRIKHLSRYFEDDIKDRIHAGMTVAPSVFGSEQVEALPNIYPDTYERLGLIKRNFSVSSRLNSRVVNNAMNDGSSGTEVDGDVEEWYEFTEYAVRFLDACHGPLPKHDIASS